MTNDKKILLGSALAAFTLAAGCSSMGMKKSASSASPAAAPTGTLMAKGECSGINACKGTGECGGVGHGCAGKNSCKGQGWVTTTEGDCKTKGGTFKAN